MKKTTSVLTLLLIIAAIYWSFKGAMPAYNSDISIENTAFSTDRALEHVKNISKSPHAVGFPVHREVREYILNELRTLGLNPDLQEGYSAGDWGNLSKATNILARIEGSGNGKALLLLSHYDSNPHSSLGASDAGSGVATILEGVRAYLATGQKPKNDIIILISDAEELGLNGADLFVNQHPWAAEVGLVLNFEARGSGGPGYMLIETNRGNGKLIEEFIAANPKFPVANSLAYSIYKMLPNDTDLTVFREDRDIEGFNFAFIDDHYDYHTVLDSFERLDKESLAHQGSYLMPLLLHFSEADLNSLKSLDDYNYFSVPFFKMVIYPYEWIWPVYLLAVLLFGWILFKGLRKKSLDLKQIGAGFIPLFLSLLINGIVGYFCWSLLKKIYPGYQDILHGFTYNGYEYISAFVLFSVAVCLWIYQMFRKTDLANLLVAPAVLWLLICAALAAYLPGASFFIVPVFPLLAGLMVTTHQKQPNGFLLLFLSLPAIFIFAPFVRMFPVGLGLKMMVAATVLTTLTFFLLLPLIGQYKFKRSLSVICLLLFLGFMVSGHLNSGFSENQPKPTSLLYVLDEDENNARWATYEKVVSDWTGLFLGTAKEKPEKLASKTLSSKYSTGFTYVSPAPVKKIEGPIVEKTLDTLKGDNRIIRLNIIPQRSVNRLEVFTNDVSMLAASANGIALSDYYLKNRRNGKLITHYISDNDATTLELTISKDTPLELTLYEASNDLLDNEFFTVTTRPKDLIPMPFVLNDAILVIKTIRFD